MSSADIELLSAPLFLGCMFSWALFGVLCIQQHDYFLAYANTDRKRVKAMVYSIFTAELLQTIFVTHTTWQYLVTGWGAPTISTTIPWSSTAIPFLNSLVSTSVQIYFAWKIYNSKEIRAMSVAIISISSLIVVLALLQLAAAIAIVVQYNILERDPNVVHAVKPILMVWLSGSFVCDFIIAVTMAFILLKVHTPGRSHIANRIILGTIEAGAVTAIVAFIQLIFFVKRPNAYLHIAARFVLGRLYSNVLLTTLNQRAVYQNAGPDQTNSLSIPSFRLQQFPGGGKDLAQGVHVSTQVHTDRIDDVTLDDTSSAKAPAL